MNGTVNCAINQGIFSPATDSERNVAKAQNSMNCTKREVLSVNGIKSNVMQAKIRNGRIRNG